MVKPFIIGTRNAGDYLYGGVNVLKEGGSALDAVEAATRLVEMNPKDTSVGLAGIPNILGVQEFDATIMCGKTMDSGAVGALQGYKHPISVARKVLDEAPHVLLVGEGAVPITEKQLRFSPPTQFSQDGLDFVATVTVEQQDLANSAPHQ